MTDHRANDLNYGHLGEAFYGTEAREWLFTRVPYLSSSFQPIGDTTLVIPPTINQDPTSPSNHRNHLRQLLRAAPELVPAVAQLRDYVDESSAVQRLFTAYDPAVGDLLGQGWAADVEIKASGRTIPILAIPGGGAGDALRIIQLGYVRQGWENDRGIWIKIPRFTGGETGWWTGDGSPLKQICVAPGPEDRGSLVAVRTFTATTFFRPLYHRSPVPPKGIPHGGLRSHRASRVNANPIFSIATSGLVMEPHADVAFNPWYPKQFAIVDEGGSWAVWDVEGRTGARSTGVPTPVRHGKLSLDAPHKDQHGEHSMADGWARIMWVADVNTIVVCGRRQLLHYDLKVDPPKPFPCAGLEFESFSDWILDIKRDPSAYDQLFILTSSRVLWLQTSSTTEDGLPVGHRSRVRVLLSWRHFRDAEDRTLRMLLARTDNATTVILQSTTTHAATSFNLTSDQTLLATSPSDPSEFSLPQHLLDKGQATHNAISPLLTLSIQKLDFLEGPRYESGSLGNHYREGGIRFFVLSLLLRDYSVHQHLYYSALRLQDQPDKGITGNPSIMQPPEWSSKVSFGAHKSAKFVEEKFIVPDWAVHDDESPEVSPPQSIIPRRPRSGNTATIIEPEAWTVPHEMSYNYMTNAAPGQGVGFLEALEMIEVSLTKKLKDEDVALVNVGRLCKPLSGVHSLEEASQALRSMFDSFKAKRVDSHLALSTGALSSPSTLGFADAQMEEMSFLAIYDHIIAYWVTPLPADVPGKARLAREKLAKTIAAELYLASTGAMLVDCNTSIEHDERLPVPANTQAAIAANGDTVSHTQPAMASQIGLASSSLVSNDLVIPPASQPQPMPYTSNAVANSSQKESLSQENPSLSRLRQYTRFRATASPPPTSIRNTLAHWSVGVNPSTYDWEATKTALEGVSEGEGRRAPPEALAKRQARKRREQEIPKLEREERTNMEQDGRQEKKRRLADGELWSATQFGLERLDAGWSTQVAPQGMGIGSQLGSLALQTLPATQVERGKFGSRPPADARSAAKRKKRIAGF